MLIACLIMNSIVACGSLAVLYFVVRRLPLSDYRAAQIIAQNNLATWERGFERGQDNAVPVESVAEALQLSPAPEPEPERIMGPYDAESPTTIITPPGLGIAEAEQSGG